MNNTAYISVEVSKNTPENRTSPVYVQEKGKLSLNDILSEKPADFNGQIDISWLHNALNLKASEIKYAPWDAVYMPKGLWISSAYGGNTIIAAAADGKICLSYNYGADWEEKQINNNLTAITYGSGIFILLSNTGKCFKSTDNGNLWEESIIAEDNFSCITYNNNKFIAGTVSGKIYISEDYCKSWRKVCEYSSIQISKISYSSSNIIMAVGVSGNTRSIYSTDGGLTWNEINMPLSSWISLTYGNGRFTACAYDGETRLVYCLEKDILNKNPVWQKINLNYNEPWKDISCGANVYTLASSTGVTLASFDGIRWIKTPCHYGAWNNILRTDYFFMIFSTADEENNLNAIRSSNGGLTGIMFASLHEIIENEDVDKAVNPKTLKDYLAYRTGKNNSQYPVYSNDLLIECTSLDTRQIKITNIDSNSSIEDYNSITTAGIYIIEKQLNNSPDIETGYLLVQKENNKIHQFISPDYLFNTGYIRQFSSNIWSSWQQKLIKQENIENIDLSDNKINVSLTSSYSDITNIIAEENGSLTKFSKDELDESINENVNNALNLMAGNNVFWHEKADYKIGAFVLGSDNALYYCIKANSSSDPQDPVSSSSFWLKIINSNGKINADNLSKNLGAFAQLDNIALTDNAITGILPVSKGGTGSSNIDEARKNLGTFAQNQLPNKADLNDNNIYIKNKMCMNLTGFDHTNFPGGAQTGEYVTYIDTSNNRGWQRFYPAGISNNGLLKYFGRVFSNGSWEEWKVLRNNDGSIPEKIGGTGLTHGALGRPNISHRLAPAQPNGSNYKSGDVIYRYSYGSSAVNQYVPSGGSWHILTFVYTKGTGICRIELGGTGIVAGGTMLDTNNQYDFIYILTKIS